MYSFICKVVLLYFTDSASIFSFLILNLIRNFRNIRARIQSNTYLAYIGIFFAIFVVVTFNKFVHMNFSIFLIFSHWHSISLSHSDTQPRTFWLTLNNFFLQKNYSLTQVDKHISNDLWFISCIHNSPVPIWTTVSLGLSIEHWCSQRPCSMILYFVYDSTEFLHANILHGPWKCVCAFIYMCTVRGCECVFVLALLIYWFMRKKGNATLSVRCSLKLLESTLSNCGKLNGFGKSTLDDTIILIHRLNGVWGECLRSRGNMGTIRSACAIRTVQYIHRRCLSHNESVRFLSFWAAFSRIVAVTAAEWQHMTPWSN